MKEAEEDEIEEEQIIEISNENNENENENEDNKKKNENKDNEFNILNEENKEEDKEKIFEIKMIEDKDKDEEDKDNNCQIILENSNQIFSENENKEEMKKKDIEEVILLIKSKIEEIKDKYTFGLKYHDIIFKILKNLEDLAFEKITNSINDSCNFLTFFKTSSEIYSRFGEEIKNANSVIMSSLELPKMGGNLVLETFQNTQNTLYTNLSKLSNVLKHDIIDNNPLSKVQEKSKAIDSIKKTQLNKYNEIYEIKQKLMKKYTESYEGIFGSFIKEAENNEQDINIKSKILFNKNDYLCLFKDFMNEINKLILQINVYISQTSDNLLKINYNFNDINNLVRDSVLIYIEQSKGIFSIEMNNNCEKIKQFYQNLNENSEENMFKLDIIFDKQENKEKINNSLEEYYKLLKDEKKKELDTNLFSINSHSNLYLFFEWLIKISPKGDQLYMEDLIIKKVDVKRYDGYFFGWNDCIMVFTKQKHIIVYNKSKDINKSDTIFKFYELPQTTFIKKNDNKNPFTFDLKTTNVGTIMNSNETNNYDALNKENLDEISLLFNIPINREE
jgi:hypothetical protein